MEWKTNRYLVFPVALLIISGLFVSGCLNGYDELELNEFKFVEDEDNEDEIEEGYEYGSEEDVFVYFEVEGFEADDGIIDWTILMTVMDSDGEPYPGLNESEVEDETADIDADWGIVEFTPNRMNVYPAVGAGGWEDGENEIEIQVVDNIGDEELTFTETFEVSEEE